MCALLGKGCVRRGLEEDIKHQLLSPTMPRVLQAVFTPFNTPLTPFSEEKVKKFSQSLS